MTTSFLPPPLPDSVASGRYWDPGKIKDDTHEFIRLGGTYASGHSVRGWRYWTEGNVPVYSAARPTETPNIKMRADRTTGEMKPDYPQEVLLLVGFVASQGGFRLIEITQKSLLRQIAAWGDDAALRFTPDGLADWAIKIEKNTKINQAVVTYLAWAIPNKPPSPEMAAAWLEFAPTVNPAQRLLNLSPFANAANPPLPDVPGAEGAGDLGEDLASLDTADLPEGF